MTRLGQAISDKPQHLHNQKTRRPDIN